MKRKAKNGGSSTNDRAANDPDAAAHADYDWAGAEVQFELDPKLVEQIRIRRALTQITLRVGAEQIAEARRLSKSSGIPYQTILRRWLAEGASIARSRRMK